MTAPLACAPSVTTHTARHSLVAALLALTLASAAPSAHAIWGLLGKAASAAGKSAGDASTAGKAAGAAATAGKVGVAGTAAVAGAELAGVGARASLLAADDAARVLGKAPLSDLAHASHAALPPEVATYLARPAKALSPDDTSRMMQVYQDLMAKAARTGDFTLVEQMPSIHSPKSMLPAADAGKNTAAASTAAPAVTNTTTGANSASKTSNVAQIELYLHATRLLAHAASAGNRDAQREVKRRCQAPMQASLQAEHEALCRAAKQYP